jgi:transcriptional regulator with GAF, ATPase, and Fis domain
MDECRETPSNRPRRRGTQPHLDEVSETSGPFQAKLLRALQEREGLYKKTKRLGIE